MGLFDTVKYSMNCPCCGETIPDFQTKDNDPCLLEVEPWTVTNFYSGCPHCSAWIEFNLREEYTQTNVKQLVQAGHDLIKAMESFLDNKGDPEDLRQKLNDSVFKKTIGKGWEEYYKINVTPPTKI